jgi:hypothetical protein
VSTFAERGGKRRTGGDRGGKSVKIGRVDTIVETVERRGFTELGLSENNWCFYFFKPVQTMGYRGIYLSIHPLFAGMQAIMYLVSVVF